ncbi:hypothetical protein SDC9_167065 [bioreactor metagenome]|uniref:Uncharacterized protein n=1 Tax=bioreactor metagenome TaxID=1076179 RepID=A0A645G6Y3_9ZZZZ
MPPLAAGLNYLISAEIYLEILKRKMYKEMEIKRKRYKPSLLYLAWLGTACKAKVIYVTLQLLIQGIL